VTILVTGGAGFVGLNVVEQLLARGERVVVADRNPLPAIAQADFERLPGRFERLHLDVASADSVADVIGTTKPAKLIHLAAITAGAERDAADPRSIAMVNFVGTINVLEAARHHGVGRIVCASTGALYGAAGIDVAHPLDEIDDRPVPQTMYGITKHAAERTALRLRELWQLDLVVGRLAMVYGRWEYATGVRDTISPVWKVTRMALRGGETAVFPDSGALDWIYGADIGRALIALLDAPAPRHAVYHLGVENPWPLAAWCEALRARFPSFAYRTTPDASQWTVPGIASKMRTPFSARRLREDLGFAAAYPLARACDDYLAWIDAHRGFLDL
jgi:nucleoside-diphosphate-sugar epimerase